MVLLFGLNILVLVPDGSTGRSLLLVLFLLFIIWVIILVRLVRICEDVIFLFDNPFLSLKGEWIRS